MISENTVNYRREYPRKLPTGRVVMCDKGMDIGGNQTITVVVKSVAEIKNLTNINSFN